MKAAQPLAGQYGHTIFAAPQRRDDSPPLVCHPLYCRYQNRTGNLFHILAVSKGLNKLASANSRELISEASVNITDIRWALPSL